MNSKKIITIVLLLFVGASVVGLIMQNSSETIIPESTQDEVIIDNDKQPNRLIVYYLHGNVRCQTCEKLEAFSTKALTSYFAKQLEDGTIQFSVLNYDEPDNEHFLNDFDISFQSLVVVDIKENKTIGYENLAKIWDLTHDEEAYLSYVKENIDSHIKAVL